MADNQILGMNTGITRIKGTSPKVSKDSNRPRQIKQFGAQSAAGLGSVGLIGSGPMAMGAGGMPTQGYVIRNISSSKGMNR